MSEPRVFISYRTLRWLIFVTLIFLPSSAHSTTIVLVPRQNDIVFAADGRLTVNAPNGAATARSCKVRNFGKFLFAASGLYQDVDLKFNLWELAERSIGGKNTITAFVNALRKAIESQLQQIIEHGVSKFPEMYRTWQSGTPIVSMAIAAIEDGHAVLTTCDFVLSSPEASCTAWPAGVAGKPIAHFIGIQDNAKGAAARDGTAALADFGKNPTAFASSLVEREIVAERLSKMNRSGPPITTGIFDKSGIHWVDKGACQK
jgi:hypothetical protein